MRLEAEMIKQIKDIALRDEKIRAGLYGRFLCKSECAQGYFSGL